MAVKILEDVKKGETVSAFLTGGYHVTVAPINLQAGDTCKLVQGIITEVKRGESIIYSTP